MGWFKRRRQAKFTDGVSRKIIIKVVDSDGEPIAILQNMVGNTHAEIIEAVRDFRSRGMFVEMLESITEHDLYAATFQIVSPEVPCPDCGTDNGYAIEVAYSGEHGNRVVRDPFGGAFEGHRADCQFLPSIREATN